MTRTALFRGILLLGLVILFVINVDLLLRHAWTIFNYKDYESDTDEAPAPINGLLLIEGEVGFFFVYGAIPLLFFFTGIYALLRLSTFNRVLGALNILLSFLPLAFAIFLFRFLAAWRGWFFELY